MLEIERKFLVRNVPYDLFSLSSVRISQGYLAVGNLEEIRLRRREDQIFLTVKQGQGLSRIEAEVALDIQQFTTLWPLTRDRRIEKIRYSIPFQNKTIELDVFKGGLEGLRLAEVEFESEEAAKKLQPPEWFGKEVTADERYKNKNLALKGRPRDDAPA